MTADDCEKRRARRRRAAVSGAGRAPLRVAVTDGRGRRRRAAGLCRWLSRVAPAAARGRQVVIAVVDDETSRALNRQYRRKNRPTDVLSFPLGDADRGRRGPRDEPPSLGDIVIARGVARAQARVAGHPVEVECRLLALHGLLHLLGYDHERDQGQMRRFERRLRRRGGIVEARA